MSGPKLSQAELEKQRQAELERQRREYLRRLAESQRQHRKASGVLASYRQQIADWLDSDTMRDLAQLQPAAAAVVRNKLTALAQQMLPVDAETETPEAYEGAAQKTLALGESLLRKAEAVIREEEQRFADRSRQNVVVDTARELGDLLACMNPDQPIDAVVDSFLFDADTRALRAKLRQLAAFLRQWEGSTDPSVPGALKNASRELMQYAAAAGLEKHVDMVKQWVESLLNMQQEYLRRKAKRDSLYEEYLALNSVLGGSPLPPDRFTSAQALQKTVEELREAYRRKDEMDFIADAINEVMVELGYRFVSSSALTRADGTEFDYSLYQADESAGISIFTDETGAVMMQMTNLGDGDVTAQDADESYQKQLAFCAAHPDIVEALARKGVILKKKNYAPPNKRYVRKQKVTNKADSTKVSRRGRRRDKPKVRHMRRGE